MFPERIEVTVGDAPQQIVSDLYVLTERGQYDDIDYERPIYLRPQEVARPSD